MSVAHAHDHDSHGHGGGHAPHEPIYYVKIWALLVLLLCGSLAMPLLGNKMLTVISVFGVAIVKALIVAAFFMHLNVEKRYIWYLLFTMLGAVAIFFFGVAADVMKYSGSNWTKPESHLYAEGFKKAFAVDEHEGEEAPHAAEGAKTEGAK